MTPDRAVILRYHEIALKGLNRSWFEDRLTGNARRMIEREIPHNDIKVLRQHGRILIEGIADDRVRAALGRVFGISSYSPVRMVETDREAIKAAAIEELRARFLAQTKPRTFRVLSRRSDKVFEETSTDIDRWLGTAVQLAFPDLQVDLKNPEMILGLEVRRGKSYLWTEKIPGYGGLPVGSNARVLTLISGGLDSPVAAIQVLRRGSPTDFIHFYGAPFVGEEVLDKVKDLVAIVNRYQPENRPLHVIPFGKLQEKIALVTQPKLRTILYRRMMIRIACALARRIKAHALVTGESLGQVASQTVENLGTINAAADLPILRPLITYDKDEIIEQAKRWGSFDTSIRPGADCCTLFADRHPSIRSTLEAIQEEEKRFPVSEFCNEALESAERF